MLGVLVQLKTIGPSHSSTQKSHKPRKLPSSPPPPARHPPRRERMLSVEGTFYLYRTHSIYIEHILSLYRTHSIYIEHILSTENAFYLKKHILSKENTFYLALLLSGMTECSKYRISAVKIPGAAPQRYAPDTAPQPDQKHLRPTPKNSLSENVFSI